MESTEFGTASSSRFDFCLFYTPFATSYWLEPLCSPYFPLGPQDSVLSFVLHLALLEPEIALNVGSVARTALACGARLHLIRPLGFRLTDAALRRSGMDYWDEVDVTVHPGFAAFAEVFSGQFAASRVFSLTTKGKRFYNEVEFRDGDVLLFGPESRGLPEVVRAQTQQLRIPMTPAARSLNLAVSVGVVVYEAWRQLEFGKEVGRL